MSRQGHSISRQRRARGWSRAQGSTCVQAQAQLEGNSQQVQALAEEHAQQQFKVPLGSPLYAGATSLQLGVACTWDNGCPTACSQHV